MCIISKAVMPEILKKNMFFSLRIIRGMFVIMCHRVLGRSDMRNG